MRHYTYGLLLIALLSLTCPVHATSTTDTPLAPAASAPAENKVRHLPLFKESVEPEIFELPSGALSTWRKFSAEKPALLLFSAHPFLEQVPAGDREEVRQLVRNGTVGDIIRRGRLNVADTALISPQTVSAAIDAGLIAELIYVLPTSRKLAEMSLTDFQQRAFSAGFLTEKEALALTIKEGIITGSVRGLPFRCVHPEALPKINRPVIVHLDLGYFKNLYVNEVKTPAYALLYQTATALRSAAYPVLSITLSYSNQEADYSLESRFLISNLSDLLRRPALLDGGTPASWQLRSDALYAGAMFATDKAMELSIKAAETNPDDPAALYLLSLIQLEQRQSAAALATLDRAVALDPGYALNYLDLADAWLQSPGHNSTVQVLALLNKANAAFPENPFILIQIADLLIGSGKEKEGLSIVQSLKQLSWSPTYHPKTAYLLAEMAKAASATPTP